MALLATEESSLPGYAAVAALNTLIDNWKDAEDTTLREQRVDLMHEAERSRTGDLHPVLGCRAGEGVPLRVMAFALRLPDALFRLAARGMLSVDKNARSSMWEDLRTGRLTEIDHLQGEIVRLAAGHGIPAPLNRRVLELVKEAEEAQNGSPALTPEAIGARALRPQPEAS